MLEVNPYRWIDDRFSVSSPRYMREFYIFIDNRIRLHNLIPYLMPQALLIAKFSRQYHNSLHNFGSRAPSTYGTVRGILRDPH